MPVPCTCFISYPHVEEGEENFFSAFVEELRSALRARLRMLKTDADVILDVKRLKPGFKFNETISKDICRAACMVVVYVPAYEEHTYCLREFEAMTRLEEMRLAKLQRPDLKDQGMIIPIIFRGDEADLPWRIKSVYNYVDLSRVTPKTGAFLRQKNSKKLDDIAKQIVALYKTMQQNELLVWGGCDTFDLPQEHEIKPWRQQPLPDQAFPR